MYTNINQHLLLGRAAYGKRWSESGRHHVATPTCGAYLTMITYFCSIVKKLTTNKYYIDTIYYTNSKINMNLHVQLNMVWVSFKKSNPKSDYYY